MKLFNYERRNVKEHRKKKKHITHLMYDNYFVITMNEGMKTKQKTLKLIIKHLIL